MKGRAAKKPSSVSSSSGRAPRTGGAAASSGRNPTVEEVTAAYQQVLRRAPDEGGLETYTKSKLTGAALLRELAGSAEAARLKNFDPAAFGAKVYSQDMLSDLEREAYDKFSSSMGWQNLTEGAYKQLSSLRNAFASPEAEAEFLNRRIILQVDQDASPYFIVTPQAVANLGANLSPHLKGAGNLRWVYPTEINLDGEKQRVSLRGDRFSDALSLDEHGSPGFSMVGRIPKPGSGLQGFFENLGMGPDGAALFASVATANPGPLLDETFGWKGGYFLTDPLGITSGLAAGQEGALKNVRAGARTFGTSEERFQKVQGIGKAAGTLAVSVVNPFAGAALSSVDSFNRAAITSDGFGKAALQSGLNFAAAGLTKYTKGMDSAAYINALGQGASGYVGSRFIYGQSNSDAMKSAAWAAGGSLLGSALGNVASGLAPDTSFGQAAALSLSSLAGQSTMQGLRGGKFNTDFWTSAALNAGAAGAQGWQSGGELAKNKVAYGQWNAKLINVATSSRGEPSMRSGGLFDPVRLDEVALLAFQDPTPIARENNVASQWNRGFGWGFTNDGTTLKDLAGDAWKGTKFAGKAVSTPVRWAGGKLYGAAPESWKNEVNSGWESFSSAANRSLESMRNFSPSTAPSRGGTNRAIRR